MKVHLLDSPDPIRTGATVAANCGEEIEDCRIVFMWDDIAMESPPRLGGWEVKNICVSCLSHLAEARYTYGVVTPEDAKKL